MPTTEEQLSVEEVPSTEAVETSTGEAPTSEGLETQQNGDSPPVESGDPTLALDETAIREQVKAELEAEYSKRLSGLQSEKDKQIAELRRGQQSASAAKFAQAQQMAESDPAGAWQIANTEWANQQQQQQVELLHGQWSGYVNERLVAEGLDASDAEAQALIGSVLPDLAQQSIANPSAANTVAMGLSDKLRDLANSRKDDAHKADIKDAEARGAEVAMAQMDEKMDERMATLYEELGIAPDASVGAKGPAQPVVSYTKMSKAERDKAARDARQVELKALFNK